MTPTLAWKTAWKIAWREARASRVKFFFVVLAVAVGVGALTGVRGFSSAFRRMLLKEARTLMAADLSVRQFVQPTPVQQAAIDRLEREGIQYTRLTETITMAASEKMQDPMLVSVKAVDPAKYPFYGELKFEPAFDFAPDAVAVSQDLLIRLEASVGETMKIGGTDFRIGAVVVKEPDRMTGSINVGPRLMMSRAGLERTVLVRPGSRAAQRVLFKLPPGRNVDAVRQTLKSTFPEALIADYRETHPLITRGLDRSTTFLSLVSLMALMIGAIGVAMAIHAHLQQRLDSMAIMKCMGARSAAVMRIYLLQTLALGLLGGAGGVVVGALVQAAFPAFLARYFPIPPDFSVDVFSLLQGLAIAVLMTVLFTMPPLLRIRDIRPISILRRDVQAAARRFEPRLFLIGVVILLGVGGVAGSLTLGTWRDALKLGAYFVGGLGVSLIALVAVSAGLLALLKRLRTMSLKLPATFRHGLANLYRPGSQARTVLVTLGVGVMFTLTIYLLQKQMIGQLSASAPPGMPNVFLLDIQAHQRDGLVALLKKQKGVAGEPEIYPSVAVRLQKVNGQPVTALGLEGFERRFLQTRSVTWAAKPPDFVEITSGLWPMDASSVAVSEPTARALKLTPGATLDFSAAGREFGVRVACVYKSESVRVGSGVEFIFQPAQLAGLPVNFFGGVRVAPNQVAQLQRASYREYPTVSVINIADVLEIVQQVIDQIAVVVRFISAFAILAGAIILAASVAGTRFRRVRETVILKTLGGTRRRIAGIFSTEFALLGAVAGLIGALLANGFTVVIFRQFFEGDAGFRPLEVLAAVALTALVANAAGWLASLRVLTVRPLEALREE